MFQINHGNGVKFECLRAGGHPCVPCITDSPSPVPSVLLPPCISPSLRYWLTTNRSSLGLVNSFSNSFWGSIAVVVEMHMAHPADFIVLDNLTVISSILVATATVLPFVHLFVGSQWSAAGNHSEIAHCYYDFVKDMWRKGARHREKNTWKNSMYIFFKGAEIYCDMAVYLILYSSCFLLGVLENDIPVIRIFFPLFSFFLLQNVQ